MQFEWDAAKDAKNITSRGISFSVVERVDFTTAVILNVTRVEDGEDRFKILGMVDGVLHAVIYTPRSPKMRIISVRLASRKEREFYATQA